MTSTEEEIARVAHEANRGVQDIDGDECPSPPWASEDPDVRALTVRGVALARDGRSPEQLHEAWCDGKRAEHWVYGEVKSSTAKTHPCLIPYRELPENQQAKDRILHAIVAALTTPADVP